MSQPKLSPLRFEHHHTGLGIGHNKPRISWKFQYTSETVRDWTQTAYDIEIATPDGSKPQIHSIESNQSVLVPWPGSALKSRQQAQVRVRVYGRSKDASTSSEPTAWSDAARVEAGLLDNSDWNALPITSVRRIGPEGPLQPLRFRKEFTIDDTSQNARLYITALGIFEAYINGRRVDDECMAPGWTSYSFRHNYRTIDVGKLLQKGSNVIAVEVAEGWYAGRLAWGTPGTRFWYGKDLAVLAQLELSDSSTVIKTVSTDDTWTVSEGPLRSSEIYDGEYFDARQEQPGWNTPNGDLDRKTLQPCRTLPIPSARLVSSEAPPVRITQTVTAVNVFKTPKGKVVMDFGQNLVGKLLVKQITLVEGQEVSFRHAEVMEDGELGIRPLRYAKATDTLVGSGKTLNNWSPHFTFHGFRYAEVNGWPSGSGLPDPSEIVAQVVHSDMQRRGYFECSNPMVNKLHQNVVWSMRSNFLSIPTDCPQRDERLGWTGDLQVFAPSATFLYDTVGLIGNWLEDLMVEQLSEEKGGIPGLICPDVIPRNWPHMPQAVWDDITVLTPDVLYRFSGDKDILSRQLPSGQAWLDKGIDRGPDHLWSHDMWQLADWLDPTAPPESPGEARTDNVLVADAYLVHVTTIFARVCKDLHLDDLARRYSADASALKSAFQHKYITPYGNLMSNSQTGLALALQHDLYRSTAERAVAATSLRKLVRSAKFHIATGFAGTPVITHALTTTAQPQLAYRMLLEKTCPSWLYPVTQGATTIWERWDSMLPDGRINPGEMTSFNHYALGAVSDWLHSCVGGISPLGPGWRVVKVRPVPGGGLTSAKVSFDGPYGIVGCEWTLDGQDFEMKVRVPPNSKARVTLPSKLKTEVSDVEEEYREVGSGLHVFGCRYQAGEWPPTAIYPHNQTPPEEDTYAT